MTATGSLSLTIGTLPAISLPIGPVAVDYTAGVLSLPANIAGITGLFLPVTGFALNLITGLVVTVSNGAGSFAAPNPAYDAHNAVAAFPVNHVTLAGGNVGGPMPLVGVLRMKGALAVDVPVHVVGAGGRTFMGGIAVDGAPWTAGVGRVTTTGPPQVANVLNGTNMLTAGGGGSITLVSPAHSNVAGLTRIGVISALHLDLVGASPDTDGDGIPDAFDNCPHAANADQLNSSVGSATPDLIGDACQCGDVNGDGRDDHSAALRSADPADGDDDATPAVQCRRQRRLTTADVTIIKRALLTPATATIQQVCARL